MDGVHTYVEEKLSEEKLVCDFSFEEGCCNLKVVDVEKQPETKALKKVKELLKQGIREKTQSNSDAPLWESPSEWITFDRINEYKEVQDCLYIWVGSKEDSTTRYLYIGIVGDTKNEGKSKRHLAQRLNEEQKKFQNESGISIEKFRFCSIHNAQGYSVPALLKTVEMSEITVLTSLFRCENARDNIDALLKDQDIVLLNKKTSYKYV